MGLKQQLHEAARLAGDIVLHVLSPATCAHCRRDLPFRAEKSLCGGCLAGLRPMPELFCKVCGVNLPDGGAHCHNCKSPSKRRLSKCALIRGAFLFTPELRSLIHALKYKGRMSLARELALAAEPRFAAYEDLSHYRVLVPVPLSAARLRERGFNQSRLLAEVLAARSGATVLEGALFKVRHTPAQARLDGQARLSNLEGAFEASSAAAGHEILLIDDVATTGATFEACAAALKKAGAKSVAGFAIARE